LEWGGGGVGGGGLSGGGGGGFGVVCWGVPLEWVLHLSRKTIWVRCSHPGPQTRQKFLDWPKLWGGGPEAKPGSGTSPLDGKKTHCLKCQAAVGNGGGGCLKTVGRKKKWGPEHLANALGAENKKSTARSLLKLLNHKQRGCSIRPARGSSVWKESREK